MFCRMHWIFFNYKRYKMLSGRSSSPLDQLIKMIWQSLNSGAYRIKVIPSRSGWRCCLRRGKQRSCLRRPGHRSPSQRRRRQERRRSCRRRRRQRSDLSMITAIFVWEFWQKKMISELHQLCFSSLPSKVESSQLQSLFTPCCSRSSGPVPSASHEVRRGRRPWRRPIEVWFYM